MTLEDIDDVRDSLALWPGGCREFVRTKATELSLGGYIKRYNSENARVVVEGSPANISAFIVTMDELARNHFIANVVHHSQVELRLLTYSDFKIFQSSNRSCKKGHRSPPDYDYSSSTSSADKELSFEQRE